MGHNQVQVQPIAVAQVPPVGGSIADRFYRKMVANSRRYLKQVVPPEVYTKYNLEAHSEPPAIPSNKVIEMSKELGIPLYEMINQGVGAIRFSVLDYQISLAESCFQE